MWPATRHGQCFAAARPVRRFVGCNGRWSLSELLPNTGTDGIFGPATEQAVGIGVEGIMGPKTWARLLEPPVLPVLRRGSTGAAVRGLQRWLAEIAKSCEVEGPGGADGASGHARRRRCEASSAAAAFPSIGWWVITPGMRRSAAWQTAGLRGLGRRLALDSLVCWRALAP
jgi:hypothetical protein